MAYNKGTLGKVTVGTAALGASMIFKTDGPLDDRSALQTVASLISRTALGAKNEDGTYKTGAGIKDWTYPSLMTAVKETGEVYVLYNKDALELLSDEDIKNLTDELIEEKVNKAWVKLALAKDVQNIKDVVSGIFQFKGIATAIDPDHTSLTIGYGDITVDGKGTPLISWGTSSRNIFNQVMYAWGTKNGVLTYTEEPYIADPGVEDLRFLQRKYEKGSQYIEVFGSIYVDNSNTVNSFKEWIDSLGNIVYTLENPDDSSILYVYPTSNPDGTKVATVTPIDYIYWEFGEDDLFKKNYTYKVKELLQVSASPENNGHVYQLGEEEYASNGQMWVQLGSPKTDWIIL